MAHNKKAEFKDILFSFVSENGDYQHLADKVKDWGHDEWRDFFISGALSEVGVFRSYGPEEDNTFEPLSGYGRNNSKCSGPQPEVIIPALLTRLFARRGLAAPVSALDDARNQLQSYAEGAPIPEHLIEAARSQRRYTLKGTEAAPLYAIDGERGERLNGRFQVPTDEKSLAAEAKNVLDGMSEYMGIAQILLDEKSRGSGKGESISK